MARDQAPFRAGGDIVGDKTDAALVEFMKELRGILGERPVTDEELQTAKDSLIQRLPGTFASVSAHQRRADDALEPGLAGRLLPAVHEGGRGSDESGCAARGEEVHRHRSPGDRDCRRSQSIEAPLKATNIAPIAYLDIEGAPKTQ